MTPKDFAYWLRGFMAGKTSLNEEQTKELKETLNSVFEHTIDMQYAGQDEETQAIHDGKSLRPKKKPLDLNQVRIKC